MFLQRKGATFRMATLDKHFGVGMRSRAQTFFVASRQRLGSSYGRCIPLTIY
jgi:hypothetical protein